MKPLEMILQNAARSQKRIVLSEGGDPRAIAAAVVARAKNIARIVLVGSQADIAEKLAAAGHGPDDGIEILPATTFIRRLERGELF